MNPVIILNTSNLQKGGALQVAASFVQEASRITHLNFCVILGKASSKVILPEHYVQAKNMQFEIVDIHPTESLLSIFKFRRHLAAIEHKIKPSGVITVFGPCYWQPKSPHIMGFANGYLLYEDTYFFKLWNGWKSLKYRLKKKYQQHLLKKEADYYWTETTDSKNRLANFVNRPLDKFIVASNNCSHFFRTPRFEKLPALPLKKHIRLLYVSSYYLHKGFELIPPVLRLLKEDGMNVELVLTISDEDCSRIFGEFENVINLGSVAPKHCPALYQEADIVFAPTLLETFSAIYPEAMYSKKPILTTDLPFARSICRDAALYFTPGSASDAAEKIIRLIEDAELRKKLIALGIERMKEFDLPEERFRKILNAILGAVNHNK